MGLSIEEIKELAKYPRQVISGNGNLRPVTVLVKLKKRTTSTALKNNSFDYTRAMQGVREGHRNTTLHKLISSDRAHDLPLEAAETHALTFASRCDPPMDQEEALKVVENVYKSYPPGDSYDGSDSRFAYGDKYLTELPDAQDFPVNALPASCATLVQEAASAIVCPPDFVGLSTLAALSAAIGNSRRVELKKGWTEGATLYAAMIAAPGSKKTAAQSEATRPLLKIQGELREDYRAEKEAHQAKMRQYTIDKKTATQEGTAPSAPPEAPTLGRTVVEDTTVEKLAVLLNENWRGLLLNKDELSGWLRAMDQYKQGGKGSDRQFYLSTWSNQTAIVDRKSDDEPVIVPQPFVSIIGGIQPDVLTEFGKDRDDGLMDRYLFAYPERMSSRWSDDEISEVARDDYHSTISSLFNLHLPTDGIGDPFPQLVPLSADAKNLFRNTINALREEMESAGFPSRLQGPWAKLEGYLARLALILAMTRIVETDAHAERIELEDVQNAVKLIEYFKNQARRVYAGLYGENHLDRLAHDLSIFLHDNDDLWEGSFTELHEQLDSDFKPKRPEDLSKAVRAIVKRTPLLRLRDHRSGDHRWVEIAVIAVTAVTSSPGPQEEMTGRAQNEPPSTENEQQANWLTELMREPPKINTTPPPEEPPSNRPMFNSAEYARREREKWAAIAEENPWMRDIDLAEEKECPYCGEFTYEDECPACEEVLP